MVPRENGSGRSGTQYEESGEARRASKRPYVRPSIACQNLQHAVQGIGSLANDVSGGRNPGRKPQ